MSDILQLLILLVSYVVLRFFAVYDYIGLRKRNLWEINEYETKKINRSYTFK